MKNRRAFFSLLAAGPDEIYTLRSFRDFFSGFSLFDKRRDMVRGNYKERGIHQNARRAQSDVPGMRYGLYRARLGRNALIAPRVMRKRR